MEHDHPLSGCLWIGADRDCASPVITRTFRAEPPRKATLTVTGLGYFTAQINGRDVTADRLQPVCSEYGPRDLLRFQFPLKDRLSYRIYYCTYDVTALLHCGDNLLRIQLGNGWYRQNERINEGNMSYGDTLKTIYCLSLDYGDQLQRICSDGSELWQQSQVISNSLYIGEVHDFTLVPEAARPVRVLPEEAAALSPQEGIPDRVISRITPSLMWERDGLRCYDAGQNITGVVRLKTAGEPGQQITLEFAENLRSDGTLDPVSTGANTILATGEKQIQRDRCICSGREEIFEPQFCWHGFRYFTVEGPGADPQVLVIHTDAPVAAEFDSDSEGLNFLYEAFLRSQLNNMHGSIPSDCPHRERLGYTGDGQAAAAAAMMVLDCRDFYRKWMQDILDTQDILTGHVQHTAPLGGGGGGPVGWGGAIAVVPYRYFKQYGDPLLLKNSWQAIRKWVGYICSRMEQGLVTREEEGGWCLGDWANLEPVTIPEPFVNTCLFVRYLDMLVETAPAAGHPEDAVQLKAIQQQCRAAIVQRYFDPSTGRFCGSVQGADAYGLHAGLGDLRTRQHLKDRYEALGYFDTGFLGTDVLLEELFRLGAGELAFRLLTTERCGSFLYMKRRGATTLWEYFDGRESQDHPMFGGCVRHLFEGFAGIRQAYGTGGYTQVAVEPCLPQQVSRFHVSLPTPGGALAVTLTRSNGVLQKTVTLPSQQERKDD